MCFRKWINTREEERLAVISKLGKIAFYSRLYRSWIYTPAGKKGFLERFPEPKIEVHPDIINYCTGEDESQLSITVSVVLLRIFHQFYTF